MTKKKKHPEISPSMCIVVGPMPFSPNLLKQQQKYSLKELVFIDGGSIHESKFKTLIKKQKLSPQFYGDGDSSKKIMTHKKIDLSLSDLSYFLNERLQKKNYINYDLYLFVGFLGGRIDHQLINIGEFFHVMKNLNFKPAPRILLDDKIEFFAKGINEMCVQGIFSIASFEKCKIKISGDCL